MRRFSNISLLAVLLVVTAGCGHGRREAAVPPLTQAGLCEIADTVSVVPHACNFMEVRLPDMRVHVRRGERLTVRTEGLTLTATGDAVQREADYSVTSLKAGEIPPLPQEMVNTTAAAAGYRLLPGGEHFQPYAELRITYDPSKLPHGYTPYDIYTSYYDSSARMWVRLERTMVDTISHEIVSLTTHFTDFVNELIKVPEMPETQALVPTAMNDLEAVSPLDGQTFIQPPTANNNGTANLSYPLAIPAGRGGMQPSLALTYSSAGGGGWLGVGWDIPVSSITLDTRWGVPRYSQSHETEIYLLDGEQLTAIKSDGTAWPMPHRTNNQIPRLSGSVGFKTRTGDAHDSIVRHGDTPKDYWWEVTDRNGTTHRYGRYVDMSRNGLPATLCDDENNIARWMLTESRDLHGNAVRYYYDLATVRNKGAVGRQIYLDSISYTGHDSVDGYYTVVFCRTVGFPADIPVACNNGFKEITEQRLGHVYVKYGDSILTAWLFDAENSYFSNYKNRLKSVTKIDSADGGMRNFLAQRCRCIQSDEDDDSTTLYTLVAREVKDSVTGNGLMIVYDTVWNVIRPLPFINTGYAGSVHWFEYYDAPTPDSLFGAVVTSHPQTNRIRGNLVTDPAGVLPAGYATALGLSHSSEWSIGGTAALGLGPTICLTTNSLGANYTYGKSSGESLMSLVDLDGDGLADKVFVSGGKMYFCRHIHNADGTIDFEGPVEVQGASHFLKESGSSNTIGLQLAVGFSGSVSWTDANSTTSTYFADVNGDGLVDIVDNGQVLFNSLSDGYPQFTLYEDFQQFSGGEPEEQPVMTSASNCGGIIFDGGVDDSITCERIWVPDTSFNSDTVAANAYVIQYRENNDTMVLVESIGGETGAVSVTLLHREWDCSYHDDALNTEAVRVWVAPRDGTIKLHTEVWLVEDTGSTRRAARHADGVVYTVQHTGDVGYNTPGWLHAAHKTILYSTYICDTCYGDKDLSYKYKRNTTVRVSRGDIFFFRLRSGDSHQFDNIESVQQISYTDGSEYYDSRNDFVLSGDHCFQAPVGGYYEIVGEYTDGSSNEFRLDITANGTVTPYYGTQHLYQFGRIEKDSTICFSVSPLTADPDWGKVECRPHVSFYPDTNITRYDTAHSNNAQTVDSCRFLDTIQGWIPCRMGVTHSTGSIYSNKTLRRLFGQLYHGWGQFAYHSLDTGANASYIFVERLIPANMLVSGVTSQSDTAGLRDSIHGCDTVTEGDLGTGSGYDTFQETYNIYSPLSRTSYWVEMTPDVEHGAWVSYGRQNSIGRTIMSNAIQEAWYSAPTWPPAEVEPTDPTTYDDPVPAASPDGGRAKAVRKKNISKTRSYSVGAAGVGLTCSQGTNTVVTDYLDLNGDRYPDNVGVCRVQYSQQWGGIGPVRDLPGGVEGKSFATTFSHGKSYSASTVHQKRIVSGRQGTSLFTMKDEGGGSFSAGGNIGHNNASGYWLDINGDGLPDFISDDGGVHLNIGYDFRYDKQYHNEEMQGGVSGSVSLGANALASSTQSTLNTLTNRTNVWQGSIQAGASIGGSYNQATTALIDLNGDGLPDRIHRRPASLQDVIDSAVFPLTPVTSVEFNLGNGHWSQGMWLDINRFQASTTYNESLSAGLTYGFTFWGTFKVTVGVDGCPHSGSVCRDHVQLVDVNADGLPDLVGSGSEGTLKVRYNQSGRTNLLRSVTNAAGASFEIDYTLSEPDYNQPSRSWLMTQVTTRDTLNAANGSTVTITGYQYHEPRYDRYERTSYGYGQVTTTQIDPVTNTAYRITECDYYNSNMLRRGRPRRERTYAGDGRLYIEKLHDCTYIDYANGSIVNPDDECPLTAYPYVEATLTNYYEGNSTPKLTVGERIEYDRYHNVVKYEDLGDTADPNDGVTAYFTYSSGLNHNLVGLRESYELRANGSGELLRAAEYRYDTVCGKLLHQLLQIGNKYAEYDFTYDSAYGNLTHAKLPPNAANERLEYKYGYDGIVNTYPVYISNSYGEDMTSSYDLRFGKPTSVTYPGGAVMTYSYDFAGRTVAVRSPLDTSAMPSLLNQYHPTGYYHNGFSPAGYTFSPSPTMHPYSLSIHYDDGGNPITETAVLTNGFGRAIQTKKGLRTDDGDMMLVSGRTVTDAFGRTVRQYDPVVESRVTHRGRYNTNHDPASLTVTDYDVLDRITRTVLPLNVTTVASYSIDADLHGHTCFITTSQDPNGNITNRYTNYDGRQTQITDGDGNATLLQYDNLGQLTSATDPEGFTTSYQYDMLGRLTGRVHPDAGITTFSYDNASNLIQESTPLGYINYTYTYSRLLGKRYSDMTGNDVAYTYGTQGPATGRPVHVTDGSGSYTCQYDAMGNVIDETRTVAVPNSNEVYNFRMRYSYDSWGRMLSMTYPDGEAVEYTYQWGGDLLSMQGGKSGVDKPYIKQIIYDSYGQRSRVKYGNNTETTYGYDLLHRLENLTTKDSNGNTLQSVRYTFDQSGNITAVRNGAAAINALGGTYINEHVYDRLHRLVESQGGGVAGNYSMQWNYTPSGRITKKRRNSDSGMQTVDAELVYGYCDTRQPHTVRRMYDYRNNLHYDMRWDDAGNLGQVSVAGPDAQCSGSRFLYWTEDNRLHTVADERHYSYYAYDHRGERRIKFTGDKVDADVNADITASFMRLDNLTLYPSPYVVMSRHGYTKHYYAGAERVAACLGGGGLNALDSLIGSDTCRQDAAKDLFAQSREQVWNRTLPDNDIECLMDYVGEHYELGFPLYGIPEKPRTDFSVDVGGLAATARRMRDDHHGGREREVYFYHSDHLGSASWITDSNGEAVQHLQYLPYGEEYVSQRTGGYSERFTFSGKEKDAETGYGYFGARYMDHELMTMWLSVDPMADKYPSMSPYAYCAWNPVKLIDPNGMDTIVFDGDGNFSNRIKADGNHVGRLLDKNGNIKFDFNFVCQQDADRCCSPGSLEECELSEKKFHHAKDCPTEERAPIHRIELVWQKDIISMLKESGASNKKFLPYIARIGYVLFASDGGSLDFDYTYRTETGVWNDNTLYIPMVPGEKYAHNASNLGNFLWGAAMFQIGTTLGDVLAGSNIHALWKHHEFDSLDDQLSIRLGYSYSIRLNQSR